MPTTNKITTRLLEAAGLTRAEVGVELYTSDQPGSADMAVFLEGALQAVDGAEGQLLDVAGWVQSGVDDARSHVDTGRVLNSLGVLQAQGPALDRCAGVLAALTESAEHALRLFKRLYR